MLFRLERIKLFLDNFFINIHWKIVVKDGEMMPAGPYMVAYTDNITNRGIFWLIPAAIVIRIYRFVTYWFNRWRGRPNFFDRTLRDTMKDCYAEGYHQAIIDSRGSERRLKMFQNRLKNKNNSGLKIN